MHNHHSTHEFSNPYSHQVGAGPNPDLSSRSLDYSDLQLPGPILPIHEADPPFTLISKQGVDTEQIKYKCPLYRQRAIARRRCCDYCEKRIGSASDEQSYDGKYYHEECTPWHTAWIPHRSSPKLSETDPEKQEPKPFTDSSNSDSQLLLGNGDKLVMKKNLLAESIRQAGRKIRNSWRSTRAKQEGRPTEVRGPQQNLDTGKYSWLGRRQTMPISRPQHQQHCRENLRFLLDDPDF